MLEQEQHLPDSPAVVQEDTDRNSTNLWSDFAAAYTKLPITRRGVLTGAAVGGAAIAARTIANYSMNIAEDAASINFLTHRRTEANGYLSPHPEVLLPRDQSDHLFDSLSLAEEYPSTINKDSFYAIAQRVTRLSSWFYTPDKHASESSQETGFYKFNERFFQGIQRTSNALNVDFIATLLTWQVSGDNTSSILEFKQDIKDEFDRVGVSLAHNLIDSSVAPTAINLMYRNQNLPVPAYAAARIEGPVTLGIHDIETVMICRSLLDLEKSCPDKWSGIQKEIQRLSPQFAQRYREYANAYEQFDSMSDKITTTVTGSPELQGYLRKFSDPRVLQTFLSDGERVDAYQYTRTTAFWATICDMSTLLDRVTEAKIIEKRALAKTIDYYTHAKNPAGFFLDQIENPKMMQQLEYDAQEGSPEAQRLLNIAQRLHELSNQMIRADREIAAAIELDDSEQNINFQLLTGVAYSRWLLHDAYRHTHPDATETSALTFSDPHELAYHSFLATGNREISPSYALSGSRPLERATLIFLPPEEMFTTVDDFIENVYHKAEPQHPSKDFKTFARYMRTLNRQSVNMRKTGENWYLVDDVTGKMETFLQDAEDWGGYQRLITQPFCSWIVAVDPATAPYIGNVTRKKPTTR